MKFIKGLAIAAGLLCHTMLMAGDVPAFMNGNWMSTDGGNRFVLGIAPGTACYKNYNWDILSAEEKSDAGPGHWQLQLAHTGSRLVLDLWRGDSSLWLMENGKKYELSTIRVYDYRYRAAEERLPAALFHTGNFRLEGFVKPKEKNKGRGLARISYENSLTGETDYIYCSVDSSGRFSKTITTTRPQLYTLDINGGSTIQFLAKPGDSLLLSCDPAVSIDGNNPEYGRLSQRIAMMGDNAAFNNQFQHFRLYAANLGYPGFEMPAPAKNAGKGMEPMAFYGDLYARTIRTLERVYPPSGNGQVFMDFIRAEIRYACAKALIKNMETYYGSSNYAADSIRFQEIYDRYLAKDDASALLHDSYYSLAWQWGSRLHNNRYGNSMRYQFSTAMIEERIKKDYSLTLPPDFMSQYNALYKDRRKIVGMKDSAIIRTIFHGSREEALAFRTIMQKINREFMREADDSMNYTLFAGIPNPVLRFAANLQQMSKIGWSEDDVKVASLYRIAIFRYFSDIPGMPLKQADSVNTKRTLQLGLASILLKGDDKRLRQIDHESEWQQVMQRYKGKTVVAWLFSHHFQKERVSASMYSLQKMEERYRGKDVVFVKCLQQRHRSDRIAQLTEYLKLFSEYGELDNIVYVDEDISLQGMVNEIIDDCCVIYDSSGNPHHPSYYALGYKYRDRSKFYLSGELDSVLAGRGRYLDARAIRNSRRSWTLYDSTGGYLTYFSRTPKSPSADYRDYDSVFNLVDIAKDSLWTEKGMTLHRQPARRDQNNFFSMAEYNPVYTAPLKQFTFSIAGPDKKMVQLFDERHHLAGQYRMVFISDDVMVLQLVQ